MERLAGLFVSTTTTDAWVPDPDVPGSEMHELVHADGIWAGLTRIGAVDGPQPWTPDQRETILVLEGRVRIEVDGEPVADLGPGDMASLPAHVATVWHVTAPFKEFWVLA